MLTALLMLCGCGAPEPPEVPDKEVMPTDGDPSVVALLYKAPSGWQVRCTAEAVAPRLLLTAAHCVVSGGLFAISRSPDPDKAPGEMTPVRSVKIHPAYRKNGDPMEGNDLAVLTLDAPSGLAPLPLYMGGIPEAEYGAQAVRMVGYGAGRKQTATGKLVWVYPRLIGSYLGCFGFSGGPLFMDLGEGERLIGVVSYGRSNCSYGMSTRLGAYQAFLSEQGVPF
jgi:secreted trypsin-like serine protease